LTINDNNKSTVAVLGSTGSIGVQSLEVARSLGLKVALLTANKSAAALEAQAREFMPRAVALADENEAAALKTSLADTDIKVYGGAEGAEEAIKSCGAKTAVVAVTGIAGLASAIAAAESGMRLAMANKEAIITAADHIFRALGKSGGELIPVDSEHSAVWRCIKALDGKKPSAVILTASGGPFYGRTRASLENVTPQEALAHPTWRMGPRITIDSATMMNKGFEVIEAVRLFGVPSDSVKVLIHRQSIIHSMVEDADGAIFAQLGAPDMRMCIAYALTYPDCRDTGLTGRLNLAEIGTLTFAQPDMVAFPLLDTARRALDMGGVAPAYLNAADEVAVNAFIGGKIGFNDISDVVAETLEKAPPVGEPSLDDIYSADAEARREAESVIWRIVAL
jgi:1-deoxy-D-xylulose-5-phosphate reductoisomerase